MEAGIMATIDVEKTKEAYDFLAENPQGQEALRKLRGALDSLEGSIQPQLNHAEFITVLRGLVAGLNMDESSAEQQPADVAGYFNQAQGLVFQGQPGSLTRLGTGIQTPAFNRLAPGNFIIRLQP
jgi:hypothetical protein